VDAAHRRARFRMLYGLGRMEDARAERAHALAIP
jgi:hypothetical protein